MSKIAHIAIISDDTEALAAFYVEAFGMETVHRQAINTPSGLTAIYLSDGNINLACLPTMNGAYPPGLNHFGIRVDDVRAATDAVVKFGGRAGQTELPSDGRFAEAFILDPTGTRVDLSASGWRTMSLDTT